MIKRIDAGVRLGEYIVESKLGEGSFGEVWRARHRAFEDLVVAVKIPRDVRALTRLRDEGLFARRVEAEGAIKLLGLDADHDPPYLAMQFVDGESLRDLLRRGALRWDKALAIARRVFGVLQAAHEARIIHRDVKPENILVDRAGNAFLTDFGLAASFDEAQTMTLASSLGSARTHAVVGTLRYMAPEQKDPRRGVDHRADIYAAGLVLFEMLTGALPEGGEVPSDLVPGLDAGFDEVFRRCYSRVERRYRSAADAVRALEEIAERQAVRRRRDQEKKASSAARPIVETCAAPATPESRLRGELRGGKSPALSPNLITWDETRALLRVTDHELLRLVDTGSVARVAHDGGLFFRRQDVVELRSRLRRVATLDGIELRVLPAIRPAVPVAVAPAVALRPPAAPARLLAKLPEPSPLKSAGFLVRAAAFGVDATVVTVASALAGSDLFAAPAVILAHLAGGPHLAAAVAHTPAVMDGASLLCIAFLYFTILTAFFGRTLGKWLLGLKVVGPAGEPLGVGRSAARALGYVVSATPFGLGLLSVALDTDHRGFHDVVADSRVVHE